MHPARPISICRFVFIMILTGGLLAEVPAPHRAPEVCHREHWREADRLAGQATRAVEKQDTDAIRRLLEDYEDALVGTLEALELAGKGGSDVRKVLNDLSKKAGNHAETFLALKLRAPQESRDTLQTAAEISQWGQKTALAQAKEIEMNRGRSGWGGWVRRGLSTVWGPGLGRKG